MFCGFIQSIINIIKVMLSFRDDIMHAPIFKCGVDMETLKGLGDKIVEAECTLILPPSKEQTYPTDESSSRGVLLQIIEEWVVQRDISNTELISAFRCDYEIQFEILRKVSNTPSKLGQAEGIRFLFKTQGDQILQLLVSQQNRSVLQKFCKILGRKYLVQLGFHNAFKAIKKIGKGMTACVYNALNYATGREVAIKSFKRSVYFAQDNNNGKISFCKEFKMLTEVNHRNICHMESVFETDNSTYVILELYPLSLYGYLQKYGFPQEQAAKMIIGNLLEAMAYLHAKGIMHRDLKLENIMVKKDPSGQVIPIIVDFGLAEYTSATKYLYTRCGTPGYVAPEVLKIKSADTNQTYSSVCDVFSLGVIYHILLFRKPLFEGKDVKEVIKKNCDCEINFESQHFKSLSHDALDFFKRLLERNPADRLTASQALAHPYLYGVNSKGLSQELQAQTNCSIIL